MTSIRVYQRRYAPSAEGPWSAVESVQCNNSYKLRPWSKPSEYSIAIEDKRYFQERVIDVPLPPDDGSPPVTLSRERIAELMAIAVNTVNPSESVSAAIVLETINEPLVIGVIAEFARLARLEP